MITEQYKDKVYFSKLLCTDCPNIYKDICEGDYLRQYP